MWGSIPGLRRSPGGGHSNPLQYSCLENPMDRGAWWATVHRVVKSQTRLKRQRARMDLPSARGLSLGQPVEATLCCGAWVSRCSGFS